MLALVHVARDRRRVVHFDQILYLEAIGSDTRVHLASGKPIDDARSLGGLLEAWSPHPFVRLHDGYAVHPKHVFELRVRKNRRDWEARLALLPNRPIPVGRTYAAELWKNFRP